MSVSIREIASGVRDYLMWPDHRRVPQFTVLLRIQDKSDAQRQALNITNRNWFLSRFTLDVDSSTDEYPITATAFGRPVQCLTIDESDPNHVERDVEIVTVQNRDLFYSGTKQSLGSYTSPHVASCISIFREDNQWKAKVTPQHTLPASYVLWFQPDRPTPAGLNDNFPLLDSFINLLKVDVALSLLPNIMQMDDKGNVLNGAQVTMAERRLMSDKMEYGKLFDTYKQIAVNQQTGGRRGWADDEGFDLYW